ncbi:hypothetical protein BSKO_09681 [Bryopsis sp. KO-2023]|nr:hypothetical protein BSKO_09681 [Bryopsis sp. KO-2023]
MDRRACASRECCSSSCTRLHAGRLYRRSPPERCPGVWCPASRRDLIAGTASGAVLLSSDDLKAVTPPETPSSLIDANISERIQPDFTAPGPFRPVSLPRLEHTCVDCFPQCIGARCLLRMNVTYPGGSSQLGVGPPFPLAIISGGFLVKGEVYRSYAERLASWGYVAVSYDKVESVLDALDDLVSASFIREIIDWSQQDPLMRQLADPNLVYLIGHSRGGKVSVLAAQQDERVAGLCLIDPVDNTVYAPVAPGFPSAVAAMRSGARPIPMAIVGSGKGSDCAPRESNYKGFYEAAKQATWEVVLKDAGHFQFLDREDSIQRAVCVQGEVADEVVRFVTQAVMVAWGEAIFSQRILSQVNSNQGPSPSWNMDPIKSVLSRVVGGERVALETHLKNYKVSEQDVFGTMKNFG